MPGGAGDDVGFDDAFAASDAERRQGAIPDEMPLDFVRERADEIERILRLQFKPDPLPQKMQAKLATCPADGSPSDLVERWVAVSHFLRSVRDRKEAPSAGGEGPDEETVQRAARKLLRREPVRIELEDRTLQVTGRSYAAMIEMARHETRIDELRQDAARAFELRSRLEEAVEAAGKGSARKRRLRRRLNRVARAHRRILHEVKLHRRALYAHALTEDGAPAEGLDEAPDFWDEIGPGEHLALLSALFEAGPGRISKLGRPPSSGDEDRGRDFREDFGFKNLLSSFESDMKVEPASYFDRDLGQLVTWVRTQVKEPFDDE